MANTFKGQITVALAGVTYTMALDFNALCDFEAETGKNALKALEGMEGGEVTATDLRALMWAGLRQFHPDMTKELAGSIFAENLDAISRASGAATPGNRQRPAKTGA